VESEGEDGQTSYPFRYSYDDRFKQNLPAKWPYIGNGDSRLIHKKNVGGSGEYRS
jgi:hypothetical protein